MQTYISILRGINVSGQKKINMQELKAMYESYGFGNVATYIQSGNVVFQSEKEEEKLLAKKIEDAIKATFGFDVPVLVLTLKDIMATIKHNPFLKEKDIQTDKLHVTFLQDKPEAANIKKTEELDFSPDRFVISGKDVYVYCPNGYGNTKINNNFFESKLKVKATTRNWKTVNELERIAEGLAD
ncbi:MAG TPA: DUF1697 domain-containing protein [Flavipsychrobacter sp.]|nr:DUF1697 domain-containing protein [Flavipsychrobacter sp.]